MQVLFLFFCQFDREPHCETGAFIQLAGNADITAHGFDHAVSQR